MISIFSSVYFEENRLIPENLIRLKPYGISLNHDPARPVMILKDETGKYTMPVAVNPLEAGVALQQSNPNVMLTTPHRVTEKLLESLNIKIEKAIFVEIKDHHQYLRLFFEGHPNQGSLKVRAEEAMSLCLHLGVSFWATTEFIEKSRHMSMELDGISAGLQMHAAVLTKTHQYLM